MTTAAFRQTDKYEILFLFVKKQTSVMAERLTEFPLESIRLLDAKGRTLTDSTISAARVCIHLFELHYTSSNAI